MTNWDTPDNGSYKIVIFIAIFKSVNNAGEGEHIFDSHHQQKLTTIARIQAIKGHDLHPEWDVTVQLTRSVLKISLRIQSLADDPPCRAFHPSPCWHGGSSRSAANTPKLDIHGWWMKTANRHQSCIWYQVKGYEEVVEGWIYLFHVQQFRQGQYWCILPQ